MVHVQFRDQGVMAHVPSLDNVGRDVAVKKHVIDCPGLPAR